MCVYTYQGTDEQFDSLKTSTHTRLHIYTETLSHSIMSSHIVFFKTQDVNLSWLANYWIQRQWDEDWNKSSPINCKMTNNAEVLLVYHVVVYQPRESMKKHPGEVIICIGGNDLHSRLSCFLIISQFLKTCVCWWTVVMSCTLLLIMFASARI